jgi:hypothetical protein
LIIAKHPIDSFLGKPRKVTNFVGLCKVLLDFPWNWWFLPGFLQFFTQYISAISPTIEKTQKTSTYCCIFIIIIQKEIHCNDFLSIIFIFYVKIFYTVVITAVGRVVVAVVGSSGSSDDCGCNDCAFSCHFCSLIPW